MNFIKLIRYKVLKTFGFELLTINTALSTIDYQLTFIDSYSTMANALKIDNCELIIGATERSSLC